MAFPAGVTLRTVTFGSAVEFETGDDVEMRVVIKASRSLVWSGTPVVSIGANFSSKNGTEASVDLPVTDQVGWSDGVGGGIDVSGGKQSHTYSATVEYWVDNQSKAKASIGPFALPTGDLSPVDMDNLIPATGPSSVVVSIPDIWTIQLADMQAQIDDIIAGGGGGGGIDIHSSATKATPVDADELVLADSAASFATKKFTLANLKTVLDAAGIAKLKTARTIDGISFDGTNNITVVAPATHAATSKATPVAADEIPLADSAASFGLKRLTWANILTAIQAGIRLDQFLDPTGPVDFNSQILNNVGTPLVSTDGTNKDYVDSGLSGKVDNTALSSSVLTAFPGITLMVYSTSSTVWPSISSALTSNAAISWHFVGGDATHAPPSVAGNAVWDRPA